MSSSDRRSRPIAAVLSQGIVAGSSLLLQFIALDRLGAEGLGAFAVLFGVLVTVNSIQSGWLGDSLTVLDRFDPGLRRAMVRSQVAIVVLVFLVTTLAALPIAGVDATTAVIFGIASVAWVVEETIRRLLIARREFWKLVVNDASFAVGSFSLVGFIALTGSTFTLETLVVALFAGAVLSIGVGVMQLPRVELSRGILGPTRMREMASFAVWRAAQVGLRPGSQALVRALVVGLVSYEALGRIEAARLLLAPVLTVVNGAGVYLLPTYSAQARRALRFRPSVPLAMAVVGGLAAAYGVFSIALRGPLTDLLTPESTVITVGALVAWTAYSVGFGAGVPVGNALVARGRSRAAFSVRVVDAVVGVGLAAVFAALGRVDQVPLGLAAGTVVGAALLLRTLHRLPAPEDDDVVSGPRAPSTGDAGRSDVPTDGGDGDGEPRPGGAAIGLPSIVWMPTESGARAVPDAAVDPDPAAPPSVSDAEFRSRARARRLTAASAVSSPSSSPAARHVDRFLWALPLLLIVATEYKFRRRSIDDALGGSIDVVIALELAVYGLVGAWSAYRLAPTRPRLTPLTVVMWGYVLTTAVSAIYSAFPLLALARSVQLVIIATVIHVIATDGTLDTLRRFVHAWIVLMSVSILIGLAYVFPTTNAQKGRFTWLSVHSVSAGSMLAISVTIVFGLWMVTGQRHARLPLPWPRWVYGTLLVFQSVFLLATRTRGSIGGALIGVAIVAWVLSGQKAKPQLVLGSFVTGGALLLAFGGTILEFLTRGESAEKIGTFNRRTEIWTLAWEAFLDHPLQGLGFTSAKGVFFDETGLGGAHNAVINVMIDVGLAGLAWWFALLVAVGVAIGRLGAAARSGVAAGGVLGSLRVDHTVLLGIFVASLVNSVTTEGLGAGVNVSAIWLFLMAAWLCVLHREARPLDDVEPGDVGAGRLDATTA